MEDKSCVTRSIIDELHFSDIKGDQMEGESGVTRSIIDELHFSDIQGDQMEGQWVLHQVLSMNVTLGISREIKWKVEAWCHSKYHR